MAQDLLLSSRWMESKAQRGATVMSEDKNTVKKSLIILTAASNSLLKTPEHVGFSSLYTKALHIISAF